MKKPLEKTILRDVLNFVELNGLFLWRQNSGAFAGVHNGKKRFVKFHAMPGCSDIIGVLPTGRFCAIETKRPGEHPTPEQQSFIDTVNRNGGLAFVAYGVDDVQRELTTAGVRLRYEPSAPQRRADYL